MPPTTKADTIPIALSASKDEGGTSGGSRWAVGDTHLDVHIAAALDERGGLLGTESFPASPNG